MEPLGELALDLLQFIDEGLTNQEITSRPYLTLNTIKVHGRKSMANLMYTAGRRRLPGHRSWGSFRPTSASRPAGSVR